MGEGNHRFRWALKWLEPFGRKKSRDKSAGEGAASTSADNNTNTKRSKRASMPPAAKKDESLVSKALKRVSMPAAARKASVEIPPVADGTAEGSATKLAEPAPHLDGIEEDPSEAKVTTEAAPQPEIATASSPPQEQPQETPSTTKETSPISLNIIIVGAGIGGLATAYVLGKAGHKVTVLESASQLGEVGAGIQLSPNVTRLLIRWGVGEKLKAISVVPQSLSLRRYEDGELVGWRGWGDDIEKEHGAPYYHVHRADIHRILADLAETCATIRLNSRVTSVDPTTAAVTLASGETIEADLIVGADGIHSKVRDFIGEAKDSPRPTGDAAYRATIPVEAMLGDPELKAFIDEQGVNVWMGPGRHIVGYCIRNKLLYNLVMVHPARDVDENVRDSSIELMKSDYADFEPRLRKLLELVPSTMVWSLMDRPPLDSWVHADGKVCLLGDACHPMLPYRAQGAATAIEDAAVLGNLLSRITSPSQLRAILHAYQDLRYPRATENQTASRLNQRIFHFEDGPEQRARDASMRVAMEAALKEAQGESTDDCAGSANLWADKERNRAAFDYDADVEVEKWCSAQWKEVVERV